MADKPIDEFGRLTHGAQSISPLPDTEWIHDDPVTHERPEPVPDATVDDESQP